MRGVLFLGFLFLSLVLSAQQSQVNLLNDAFKTKSEKKLKLFVDNWAKSSALANSRRVKVQNDTVNTFHEIYLKFFLGENKYITDTGAYAYGGTHYILLPENSLLQIADNLPSTETLMEAQGYSMFDTLRDLAYRNTYRSIEFLNYIPAFKNPHVKVLLLTKNYRSIIENFLAAKPGSQSVNHFTGQFETVKKGHDDEKVQFLSAYLPMVERHWGHYWNYKTYPAVDRIILNKELTLAYVYFSESSSQNAVLYLKTAKGWVLYDSWELISE